MQTINKFIIGLSLVLFASVHAFAAEHSRQMGFESQTPFFEGQGERERAYGIVVPEGVTINLPDGKVLKAGDVAMVPGENITVTDVEDEAEKQAEAVPGAFNSALTFEAPPSGQGVVAIAIKITTPGVVVRAADGREATTGDTVNLFVLHETIQQTAKMEEPPSSMGGFQSK